MIIVGVVEPAAPLARLIVEVTGLEVAALGLPHHAGRGRLAFRGLAGTGFGFGRSLPGGGRKDGLARRAAHEGVGAVGHLQTASAGRAGEEHGRSLERLNRGGGISIHHITS
jgi:hypothetical protein